MVTLLLQLLPSVLLRLMYQTVYDFFWFYFVLFLIFDCVLRKSFNLMQ